MPVEARGKRIVEKSTGKTEAKSSSPRKAQSAANIRNMAHAGVLEDWKASKKGGRKIGKRR